LSRVAEAKIDNSSISWYIYFMTEVNEVVEMAELTLRLEDARADFLKALEKQEARTGIAALVGKIGLRRATSAAERQGLVIINDCPIVPEVVSLAYFNALDD